MNKENGPNVEMFLITHLTEALEVLSAEMEQSGTLKPLVKMRVHGLICVSKYYFEKVKDEQHKSPPETP